MPFYASCFTSCCDLGVFKMTHFFGTSDVLNSRIFTQRQIWQVGLSSWVLRTETFDLTNAFIGMERAVLEQVKAVLDESPVTTPSKGPQWCIGEDTRTV